MENDEKKLVCPICGAPANSYMGNYRKDRLCKNHAKELKDGKIVLCDNCNDWHHINSKCKCETKVYTELPIEGFEKCVICGDETNGYAFCKTCWKKYDTKQMLDILNNDKKQDDVITTEIHYKDKVVEEEIINDNNVVVISANNKSKCITCGKQTEGLLFCASCYVKYKNKELLFKITGCTNVELLDEDYEGRYTCKDGHVVKSKSERDIDNYLFENEIPHAYEKELAYGASEKETLQPDFYLPNYLDKGKHVYIEHWGYNENNIQYTKTKKFKMPIYQKLCENKDITLICTYEKNDAGKIDSALARKLKKSNIKENEINFEE